MTIHQTDGGHRYEADAVAELDRKYIFGEWTRDPARGELLGHVLAATPPEGFDCDTATGTETGTPQDGVTGTETGGDTATETTPAATETSGPAGKETPSTGTADGTETATDEGGDIGPGDIPLNELWEMEELVFDSEFNYFVRQFGQDADGEVYVLVNRNGVPQGDTGEVLKLVPPGEGETGTPGGDTATETGGTPSNEADTPSDY